MDLLSDIILSITRVCFIIRVLILLKDIELAKE